MAGYDDNVEMLGDDSLFLPDQVIKQKALAQTVRNNPALATPSGGVQAPKPQRIAPPTPQAAAGLPSATDIFRQINERIGQRPDPQEYIDYAKQRNEGANRKLVLAMALGAQGGKSLAPFGQQMAGQALKESGDYEIPGGWGTVSQDGKVVWNKAKQDEAELGRLTRLYDITSGEETKRQASLDRAADRRLTSDATQAQRDATNQRANEGLDLRRQQARMENENRYRDDFNTVTKNTRDVIETSRVLEGIPATGRLTPIQQQSLIILLNKFQDPGSVVREGEFDRVKLAQGLLQKWGNVPAMIQSGQVLSPALQKDLQNVIKLYRDAAENTMKTFGNDYVGMAKRDNLRPENVVTDRRWHPKADAPRPGGRGTADSPLVVTPRAAGAAAPSDTIRVDY